MSFMQIFMRNIKLLLSTFFFAASFNLLQAQETKIEFSISGGYGYTMPRLKDSRGNSLKISNPLSFINTDNMNGFHIGPMIAFNINEQVGFQLGALFSRFSTVSIDRSQQALKKNTGSWNQSKTQLNAIDVPFRFVFSISMAEDLNVFLFGGPNLNYVLKKVTDTEHYVMHVYDNNNSKKGENIYQTLNSIKALDLQLGAGFGVKYHGVSLRAGYDWGVLNRVTYENVSLRANDIKVTLAYTF